MFVCVEWGWGAHPQTVLVHILARSKNSRQGPASPRVGSGSGGSEETGSIQQWPCHCPLQVTHMHTNTNC